MIPYPIVIFWRDEDQACIAAVPDLRSCSAFGDMPEEALREVRGGLELRLAVARERGVQLPPPRRLALVLQHTP